MGEWIPTSERLPQASDENNHDVDVLLWVPKAKHQGGHIYLGHLRKTKTDDDPEGKKNFWGIPTEGYEWTVWGWSYLETLPTPTHWMPLPSAPDGNEEDAGLIQETLRRLDSFDENECINHDNLMMELRIVREELDRVDALLP